LAEASIPEMQDDSRCLVIGNPPFGRQASLAIKFFNHAAAHPCVQCIAFIVPRSFRKDSIQDRLSLDFRLEKEVEIPENSFATPEGRPKRVKCVIQVWRRSDQRRQKSPRYVCNGKYHFVAQATQTCLAWRRIGSRAGQVYVPCLKDPPTQSSHYFVESKELPREYLVKGLAQVRWPENDTVAAPSISKNLLICELNRITEEYPSKSARRVEE
jgi:hypothetical protein